MYARVEKCKMPRLNSSSEPSWFSQNPWLQQCFSDNLSSASTICYVPIISGYNRVWHQLINLYIGCVIKQHSFIIMNLVLHSNFQKLFPRTPSWFRDRNFVVLVKTDFKHFSADVLDSNSISNATQQWTSLWKTWKINFINN